MDIHQPVDIAFYDNVARACEEALSQLESCRKALQTSDVGNALYDREHSGFSSLPAVDSALGQTYVKIRRLLSVISSLKSHRNSLVPISSLPPEILAEIFKYCTRRHTSSLHYDASWLAFSQVCGRWRQLALFTPSLWTAVDLEMPSLAKMMMERATSVPLDIVVDISSGLLPALDSSIRVGSIVLRVRKGPSAETQLRIVTELSSYLSGELPDLAEVRLEGVDWFHGHLDLEKLRAPHLRISSIEPVWSNSVWHKETAANLTHLQLRMFNLPILDTDRLFEGLLEGLRTAVGLETLKLIMSHSVVLPSSVVIQPVVLPHLKLLELDASMCLQSLLDLLEVPNFMTLRLSTYREPDMIAHFASLRRVMKIADWVPMKTLSLSSFKGHFQLSIDSVRHITSKIFEDAPLGANPVRQLFSHLLLSQLSRVELIFFNRHCAMQDVWETLAVLPTLQAILIALDHTAGDLFTGGQHLFRERFASIESNDGRASYDYEFFPALEKLLLHRAVLYTTIDDPLSTTRQD